MVDENSRRTRVEPVFGWFHQHSPPGWPERLLQLAEGLGIEIHPGEVKRVFFEVGVPASQSRLDWLLENTDGLGHTGTRLDELTRRLASQDPRLHVLEGTTYADALIECDRAIIWIEGKRTDWLSPATTWDPQRDQLARNVEAAWIYALENGYEDFCVLLCHEVDLRPEERALVDGYRSGQLSAGWPHVDQEIRQEFAKRIGTLTWSEIIAEWPALREDERLASLPSAEAKGDAEGRAFRKGALEAGASRWRDE
jgi:hypothetical protein